VGDLVGRQRWVYFTENNIDELNARLDEFFSLFTRRVIEILNNLRSAEIPPHGNQVGCGILSISSLYCLSAASKARLDGIPFPFRRVQVHLMFADTL
jgi:hypothetical protein